MYFIRLGAVFALLGVALGAMGAHVLKDVLGAEHLATYETAVRYQMYHAFALLAVGIVQYFNDVLRRNLPQNSPNQLPNYRWHPKAWQWAGRLFVAGIGCFCGSLYLLAFRDVLPFGVSWVGPVTPLGGVCWLAGWVCVVRATV